LCLIGRGTAPVGRTREIANDKPGPGRHGKEGQTADTGADFTELLPDAMFRAGDILVFGIGISKNGHLEQARGALKIPWV